MWQALIKLVEKWSCRHEWKTNGRVRSYDKDYDRLPVKIEEILICQKCGKIKKIQL